RLSRLADGAAPWRFNVNILYVESIRSWGGQEYRTCLEINWLNAHGHQAWLVCNPDSQVHSKASELATRVVTMPLRSRVDPLCTLRLWKFCRQNKIDLLKTYSSKDHWICLPLFVCGIPLSRARCITDPIGSVGMIRPDKGQLQLVKAAPPVFEKHPGARFVIVGQGTGILKRGINVRNAIDKAGLADKIIMAGYRWDTPNVYAACDMIVIA